MRTYSGAAAIDGRPKCSGSAETATRLLRPMAGLLQVRKRPRADGSLPTEKEVMDYQLVLQFKGNTIQDFDSLVTLEEDLQRVVEPIAEVDGHDLGSGEINIFVLTADSVATFERAKTLLAGGSLLNKVGSAYRDLRSDRYIVIWPANSADVFTIA